MNLESLNPMQREAVLHTEGPLLILAGAGSGKTRVLTHRTAYLMEEKGVSPYHLLAITFTNKAAREMRERIDALAGMGSEGVWVSTFHSTCVRILRRYIDRIGFGTNFTIYDADDQKVLMRDICRRLNVDTKLSNERSFLGAISNAKDELISPEEFAENALGDFKKQKQAQVYVEYQKMLKKNNALDFDDLIGKAIDLFRADPEVLASYQERFRYIMVDEYQDTNTAQFRLIELLAGKYRNLCVVGDDDQSIYKFRGANIYNILNFEKLYPDARVIKLEQNYRSTRNILNAANGVIANNKGRKPKVLWTENDPGDQIVFREFDTGSEEAIDIAKDIEKKVREGTYHYGDCAILYRTNAQSRLLEEALIMEGIPYKILGGLNFYARKEIKDLLSYMKTIDNGRDDLAARRIINVPRRGIGATTIAKVQAYASEKELSFYQSCVLSEELPALGRAGHKIKSFVTFIQAMASKLPFLSVSELLKEIIDETGYVEELKLEHTEESLARIENIDELISKTVVYDQTCKVEGREASLGGFLEEVALVAEIDSLENNNDYVVLMTLHSAKGLEFPNVYLAGLEDGTFPSYMTITADDPEEIEEERRLCYVGITRAMKRLTLTSAKVRMIRGQTQYNKVSRFVKEIDRELLSGMAPKEKVPLYQKAPTFGQARQSFRSPVSYGPRSVQAQAVEFGSKAGTAASALSYGIGDRVSHVKFGTGMVTNIVAGGRDYEITVDFDRVGTKKMFAVFAKLKKC